MSASVPFATTDTHDNSVGCHLNGETLQRTLTRTLSSYKFFEMLNLPCKTLRYKSRFTFQELREQIDGKFDNYHRINTKTTFKGIFTAERISLYSRRVAERSGRYGHPVIRGKASVERENTELALVLGPSLLPLVTLLVYFAVVITSLIMINQSAWAAYLAAVGGIATILLYRRISAAFWNNVDEVAREFEDLFERGQLTSSGGVR